MLRPLLDEIVLEEADKLGRGKNVPERKGACVCMFMGTCVCLCVCKCKYFSLCVSVNACVFTHMHAEFGPEARGALPRQLSTTCPLRECPAPSGGDCTGWQTITVAPGGKASGLPLTPQVNSGKV